MLLQVGEKVSKQQSIHKLKHVKKDKKERKKITIVFYRLQTTRN